MSISSYPRAFISWNVFILALNAALMIYLPYTFFFYESLPPLTYVEILSTAVFIVFQVVEIMVKLHSETFNLQTQIEESQVLKRIYMKKGLLLDALAILSLVSMYVGSNNISVLRLFIYCKIYSVALHDRYLCTVISSNTVEFFYTLLKITLIYLTFCNLTAGAFFKLDYYIYSLQG